MIKYAWIVSLGLVVVGLFLVIRGIKLILKAVGGAVLFKMPLTQKSGPFAVTKAGDYAIWQSGRALQRVPVKMAAPTITALTSGQQITVHSTFSSVWVNDGWEGRIQLFTFRAKAGQHTLELPENHPIVHTESSYYLEIRERTPGYWLVAGILLVIAGAACLIGGLILGLLQQSKSELQL